MRMSTLAAAAMAFAAYKYLKRQRTERAVSFEGMQDEIDHGLAAGTGTGTSTESPNAAERMQPAGVSPTDKWFGSSSQQGSEPISTGMPDLTRGA
jgi:hypothetical protein